MLRDICCISSSQHTFINSGAGQWGGEESKALICLLADICGVYAPSATNFK